MAMTPARMPGPMMATSIKAQIIENLIANQVDIASERYQKHYASLTVKSRKEVAWYALNHLDEDVVEIYFPDLPDPFKACEMETAKVQSLDDATLENGCLWYWPGSHRLPVTRRFVRNENPDGALLKFTGEDPEVPDNAWVAAPVKKGA